MRKMYPLLCRWINSSKAHKHNGRSMMCCLLVWCCVIICHRIIVCTNYFLYLTALLISSNAWQKKKKVRECFKFSIGRLCGELLFLLNNFQDLYQFVWNNWKQPKTFMSKWKKSKGMSHLQQSLGLKWLSLKGYKNTRGSLLYPFYQKKGKES